MKFRQWQIHYNKETKEKTEEMIYFEVSETKCKNLSWIEMQPTMLFTDNDHLDNDIYQDDIVKLEIEHHITNQIEIFYGIVEYNNGIFYFDLVNHGISIPIDTCENFNIQNVEVIGNIYENPELFSLEDMELLIK